MPTNTDLDFFVSYARHDNADGWITRFLEALQAEHRAFSGGRDFKVFIDKEDIRSLDDWQHRIYGSLAASRLFVAFVSPAYFASEWCRREWRTWIDVEIAKHILTDGAAPIYIVEVPWLGKVMTEQQVADAIAQLTQRTLEPGFAADALKVTSEVSQRQFTMVQPFYTEGLDALRREDLRKVLVTLAKNIDDRAQHVADAAKSLSTIPPYNRRFVGRLEELVKLRERLFQGRTGVISGHKEGALAGLASVHGLGGIGKTELAFTYAHAFAGLYPGGRFLIQCERLTDMRLAVLQLDSLFPGAATDEQRKSLDLHFGALREALRQRLGQLGRILLVLDNVSDLALLAPEQTDLIRILGDKLHLLATTRLGAPAGSGAGDDNHWLTLGELTFEDSLRLLEKHRPFAEAERDAAEKVARRLGGFALCVEVVGAYLGQHPEESYASFLDKMGLTDLEHVDIAAERKETITRRHNNEKRLGAILALTLAKLTPTECTTLEFASLLAPDHVVLPWLRELTAAMQPEAREAWHDIERQLVSLALLVRGDDDKGDVRVVRCHRLVQDYVRTRMTEEAAKQMTLKNLVSQRDAALEKTTRWEEVEWELPPLTKLADLWDETKHPDAAWLANQMGRRWHQLARWSEAEPLIRRVLAIDEQSLSKDHPNVATALSNLAALLQATNRFREAEPLMRRALAIGEKIYGTEHPNVAIHLSNLAALLDATNRLLEAEPLIRRALAIDETIYGTEHPAVARDLNNLAQLLKATNRLREAEPLIRRALAIDEKNYSTEHPAVARDLNNLAQLLQATNRLREAEPLTRRALAIDERIYGTEHPAVARDLNNLAQLLQATNRLREAEPLTRRALAIDERIYGTEHPDVARDLNNLAQLLQATYRLREAEPLMRRALAIDEESFGTEHPDVARDLNNLAALLQYMNRLGEAEPLTRRALAIHEQSLGMDHSTVATDLNNLAQLLQATNRMAEAEPLMARVVIIFEKNLGENHPSVATALNNLAALLQYMNRLAEAEPIIRRALAIDEQTFGKDHAAIARDLNTLAQVLKATNRLAEAESLMARVVIIFEKNLGENHPSVATALNNLALLLRATNRLAEAEPLMRRALAIDEQSLSKDHPNVARDLNNLATWLYSMNRLAEAEPLMQRALTIFWTHRGVQHPSTQTVRLSYERLLQEIGHTQAEIKQRLVEMQRAIR
jgi:tetratricopeptide (TPR) repeat protein